MAGLRAAAPEFAEAQQPTVSELRRRAIWQNYRGLIDISDAGGFGRLYGPKSDLRIPGVEYLAAMRTPRGDATTTLLLQIPAQFDSQHPCLVVVAASGSRGIYGALPTAGQWGLRRGCAVAHNDKGSGFWDVQRAIGTRIDGLLTQHRADPLLSFAPNLRLPGPAQRGAASDAVKSPHRVLLRHANSGENPEAHWGEYLLQSIDGAFELLNQELRANELRTQSRTPLSPANTLVIAAGISNGGGAVLQAVEADRLGWITGAVVAEPNVSVNAALAKFTLRMGKRTTRVHPRTLYDYASLSAVLQPCAALAETGANVPLAMLRPRLQAVLTDWCTGLATSGTIRGSTASEQASAARAMLLAANLTPAALRLGLLNTQSVLWPAIAATYAAAYARSGAGEQPCGIYFAASDAEGHPRALAAAELARLFSDSSGIAPTAGIAVFSGTGAAPGLSTMRCLRDLLPGLRSAIGETQLGAAVGRHPVIVLHGRDDGLIAVNHAARAWYTLSQQNKRAPFVRYYEVEHAQHFDAFLPLAGMRDAYIPMQPQFDQALDLMWEHLHDGPALPPSQVWRTWPTGDTLEAANLGALLDAPHADQIIVRGHQLLIAQ